MSMNESNKYVFLRVKKDTHKLVKTQSALGGFKSMDAYLKNRLAAEARDAEKDLILRRDKAKNNKRGFNLGF